MSEGGEERGRGRGKREGLTFATLFSFFFCREIENETTCASQMVYHNEDQVRRLGER